MVNNEAGGAGRVRDAEENIEVPPGVARVFVDSGQRGAEGIDHDEDGPHGSDRVGEAAGEICVGEGERADVVSRRNVERGRGEILPAAAG